MTDQVECVVVGAGVIGLAVARALSLRSREVVIVEKESLIGSGTSSRNSEVIHAGIYYPSGSLKAKLCVEGRRQLYPYCERHRVAHRRCGKLIVATHEDQIEALGALKAAAERNGVDDLTWLDAAEARAMEPELACVAALHSPSTGIVDSHGFMLSLLGEAEAHGAMLAFGTELRSVQRGPQGLSLLFNGDAEPSLTARSLILAAGLQAPEIAQRIEGLASEHQPRSWYAKGSYFALSGRSPFRRLIYPIPEPGGLGVHLTLDLAGQARFGPDVEWVEQLDYDVDPSRAERFYGAVRAYWPALQEGRLAPAYSGLRSKLSGPGEPAADFRIDGPGEHGVRGLVNLFGIESPGLTSALALADLVADKLGEALDA